MAADKTAPAIELINVSRRFLSPTGKSLTALRDFTMTVERGEFVAVVGPTGCGKSTTLNLVTGLASPSAGEVRVMGAPVKGIDPRIGFVFQTDALFPWRTVIENVMAGPLFRGKPKAQAQASARDWLARVGLARFEQHYPHQLSGGMRKRVALAQTFINGPEILLMDEPFSALDEMNRDQQRLGLLEFWQSNRKSVLFVTHSVPEAIMLSDRIVVMAAHPGRIAEVIDVDLPRPRSVEAYATDEFRDLEGHVRRTLHSVMEETNV